MLTTRWAFDVALMLQLTSIDFQRFSATLGKSTRHAVQHGEIMDEIKCDCGRVYSEQKIKLPARDVDSSSCQCGAVLKEWNGGVCYVHRLIKDVPSSSAP